MDAAATECVYWYGDTSAMLNASSSVDTGVADMKNWYGIMIEKKSVISVKDYTLTPFQVMNFTNVTVIISKLCDGSILADSDIFLKIHSEPLNEPSRCKFL